MAHVEASRDPERYVEAWPGCPIGLSRDQALNWFIAHKKPRGYVMERFFYDGRTGMLQTVGHRACQ